jgi:hypothetical protein
MNKSIMTNIAALSLIVVSFFNPVYSAEIRTMGLYSFSGAVTNWLAIHMLFEKIPGLYGSGIVTERFEDFKAGIRNLIYTQFFTKENFEKFIPNMGGGVMPDPEGIFNLIDFDYVFVKMKEAIINSPFGGMLGMFGGEQALEPLKPQFETKFKEIIIHLLTNEQLFKKLLPTGEGEFESKVKSIVDSRLDELTPLMVKDIIQKMIKEHLGWLVVWGGVFGGIIGLISTLIK